MIEGEREKIVTFAEVNRAICHHCKRKRFPFKKVLDLETGDVQGNAPALVMLCLNPKCWYYTDLNVVTTWRR